jgi:hypothetical protein
VPPGGPDGTSAEYEPSGATPPVEATPPQEARSGRGAGPAAGRGRPGRRADAERGLRGIVGAGPSQVGVVGAMRTRDAARPTPEDLAAAERELMIVRRHYVPPPDPEAAAPGTP